MSDSLHQEYKEAFAAESARREELNGAVDRPIAIITAFGGFLYFVMTGIEYPTPWLQIAQLIFAVVALVPLAMSVKAVVAAFYGHEYRAPPTPKDLEGYRAKLTDHHKGARLAAEIERSVIEHLRSEYVESAHHNAVLNDRRSGQLHSAKEYLVYTLPLLTLAGLMKVLGGLPIFQWWHSLIHT